jgi:hypothetical protein
MLIRVETSIHMIRNGDQSWKHYDTEKNLISVNDLVIDYVYIPPTTGIEPEYDYTWWYVGGVVTVGLIIAGFIIWGKKRPRMNKPETTEKPMQEE